MMNVTFLVSRVFLTFSFSSSLSLFVVNQTKKGLRFYVWGILLLLSD